MVNWRERLEAAVREAMRPPSDEEIDRARVELNSIMSEIQLMTAPLMSWQPYRPRRWNPAGLVPTMIVIEVTDGMMRRVD